MCSCQISEIEGESRREKAKSFGGNGKSKGLVCGGNEESERRGVREGIQKFPLW